MNDFKKNIQKKIKILKIILKREKI